MTRAAILLAAALLIAAAFAGGCASVRYSWIHTPPVPADQGHRDLAECTRSASAGTIFPVIGYIPAVGGLPGVVLPVPVPGADPGRLDHCMKARGYQQVRGADGVR